MSPQQVFPNKTSSLQPRETRFGKTTWLAKVPASQNLLSQPRLPQRAQRIFLSFVLADCLSNSIPPMHREDIHWYCCLCSNHFLLNRLIWAYQNHVNLWSTSPVMPPFFERPKATTLVAVRWSISSMLPFDSAFTGMQIPMLLRMDVPPFLHAWNIILHLLRPRVNFGPYTIFLSGSLFLENKTILVTPSKAEPLVRSNVNVTRMALCLLVVSVYEEISTIFPTCISELYIYAVWTISCYVTAPRLGLSTGTAPLQMIYPCPK